MLGLGTGSGVSGIVMGDSIAGAPAAKKVSPNKEDEVRQPSLTIFIFLLGCFVMDFMKVDPLGGKPAVQHLFPANARLLLDDMFKR